MPQRSRRKAREVAMQALYAFEMGTGTGREVMENTLAETDLPNDLADYAQRLVRGTLTHKRQLDDEIKSLLHEYDFFRLAAVDRNVLRVAAYELFHEPSIPPAVTINEAIEIAKKFSTPDSGRFVNGVLGKLLERSPKADWDPATAPPEEREEPAATEQSPEVEEVEVEAGSKEEREARRFGGWKLRSDD